MGWRSPPFPAHAAVSSAHLDSTSADADGGRRLRIERDKFGQSAFSGHARMPRDLVSMIE
jgi:hypothetical protein